MTAKAFPQLSRRFRWLTALALCLALAAAVLAPAAPAAAAPVEVHGVVTGDAGAPVPGTVVELYRYGTGLIATTAADPSGSFRLSLETGTGVYWVRAWAPGHAVAEQALLPGHSSLITNLQVTPLFGSVYGQVTDPDGAAVAGAAVQIVHRSHGLVGTAVTGADGRFRVDGVRAAAAGDYALRVIASGWQPYRADLPAVPGGGGVTLTARLAPANGRVTGVVVAAATGLPLAGARVSLVRLDEMQSGPAGAAVVAETTTGASGQYEFRFPADYTARYAVRAALNGYAAAASAPFSLDGQGRRDLTGAERIALTARFGGLSGRVVGSDGDPEPGLQVWLERQGAGIVATAYTGVDGEFVFSQIPADPGSSYRVRAVPTRERDQAADTGWLTVQPGQTASVSLSLPKGSLPDHGDGTVRGFVTTPGGAPVEGATVELLREGDLEAINTVTAADGSYRFDQVDANVPSPGNWASTGNRYVVRVSKSGYTASAVVTGPTPADAIDVQRERETAADLILYPGTAVLSGRVLDDSGKPVAAAQVTLLPEGAGQPLQTLSDASGQFRIHAPAPQRYRVEAVKDGYLTGVPVAAAWPVELAAGRDTAMDLVLRRATAGIAGTVTDNRGRPVAGARVTVQPPTGDPFTAVTGPVGEYTLSGLPADQPLAITVAGPGYVDSALLAGSGLTYAERLAPGEERRVDLQVRSATSSITGLVLGADGKPMAGVQVELLREGAGAVTRAVTGADGRYRFDGVAADPDARYLVRAHRAGYRFRLADSPVPPALFRVAAGETVQVHLMLEPVR